MHFLKSQIILGFISSCRDFSGSRGQLKEIGFIGVSLLEFLLKAFLEHLILSFDNLLNVIVDFEVEIDQ